jgi:threonyl-tRNA synthetase
MHVQVNNQHIDLPRESTGRDLANRLHLTAPDQGLVMRRGGSLIDLSSPLNEGDVVEILDFSTAEGKEVFWHTSAHVLAQAVLRIWPEALPTIGPPIAQGFYYDFANLEISDTDFERLEVEVQNILHEALQPERTVFRDKEAALHAFMGNPYKKELIESFSGDTITGYRQGEFFDLCRGPHLPSIGKIRAFKILKTSGAYWRADSTKEMLTRIYGISFPDKKLLKEYLLLIEEAKKRDHKILGPKLGLFSLKEEAPGMPFIHPKGMVIWNRLIEFWRQMHREAGYLEIKTPQLMSQDLWEMSGHWAHYRQNMYAFDIEERGFALKPMNCPGCMLHYRSELHSYRELPLRLAELGHVHRHEPSGALSGLLRVRSFHQDDAHLFMRAQDIKSEILAILQLTEKIYSTFGLEYRFELSTRPPDSIGSDADWAIATSGLQSALDTWGQPYKINEGDGAFYGPKIDIHVRDALGRSWQCGTVQLDMALPERFDLEYTENDGTKQRPVMLHRALFGSLERFFGILIEHFAGKFPLWLSPSPICLITVADRHEEYAQQIGEKIRSSGFLYEIDGSSESVAKKVRNAQLMQVNYLLIIGDQEIASNTVSVRTRDNVVHGSMSLDTLLELLHSEESSRAMVSALSKQ